MIADIRQDATQTIRIIGEDSRHSRPDERIHARFRILGPHVDQHARVGELPDHIGIDVLGADPSTKDVLAIRVAGFKGIRRAPRWAILRNG